MSMNGARMSVQSYDKGGTKEIYIRVYLWCRLPRSSMINILLILGPFRGYTGETNASYQSLVWHELSGAKREI